MIASILPTVKQRLANNTSEKQPTYDNFHTINCQIRRLANNTNEKQPTHDSFHAINCETKIGKQYK